MEGKSDIDPATTKEISFKFNKDIDPKSITTTNLILENDIVSIPPHEFKFDANDNSKVTIDPKKPLNPNTIYTIKVGAGVMDTKGNALGKDVFWRFTTKDKNQPLI